MNDLGAKCPAIALTFPSHRESAKLSLSFASNQP
jgi:hypothetical protein